MTAFCRILEKYGENTTIEFGGKTINAKTFIQPKITGSAVRSTHLGMVNNGEFYWFAPGKIAIDTDEKITVTTSDGVFDVVIIEKYRTWGKNSHWEGILKRRY